MEQDVRIDYGIVTIGAAFLLGTYGYETSTNGKKATKCKVILQRF